MGKFKEEDRVVSKDGDLATVTRSREFVSVAWDAGDQIYGHWPADYFELVKPRTFQVGQFVRVIADDETNGEVGFLYEDDGDDEYSDPYWVALFDDDDTEAPFSVNELVVWVPKVGERVVESAVEDNEVGTVIGINEDGVLGGVDDVSVRVLWDSFPHAQNWLVSDLEPAEEREPEIDDGGPYNEINVGDEVDYTNPFLAGPLKAVVTNIHGEKTLEVRFPNQQALNGCYNIDFFSKAA